MARELVEDELWETVQPLLPVRRRRKTHPGRNLLDDRRVLMGTLFVLQSGIPWEMLPQEMGCGSGMTCWRWLRAWQKAGVWRKLHCVLLDNELQPLLKKHYKLISIATRRQGLMVRKANPKEMWAFEDLFKPHVNFVNRQQGSGTRVILELLLKQSGHSGLDIPGFESEELTHAAVAAYVASGMADVGLGVEAAARQFDLDFVLLLIERYFFACEEATLSDPRFTDALTVLQGSRFHAELLTLPGYDAITSRQIMTVAEAFP